MVSRGLRLALVLEDNWLTSPMKEQSSVRLVGTG